MASKGNRQHIVLDSSESGHQYHTTKNKRNTTEKVELTKYDPLARKRATYKEKK
jgi:large subunit ribosomal protein L33